MGKSKNSLKFLNFFSIFLFKTIVISKFSIFQNESQKIEKWNTENGAGISGNWKTGKAEA